MNSRQLNKIAITVFSLIILYFLCYKLSFIQSEIVCGRFTDIWKNKGAKNFGYVFVYENDTIVGSIGSSKLKIHNLDSLKSMDCIKIECSKFTTYFNRVVDQRVTW